MTIVTMRIIEMRVASGFLGSSNYGSPCLLIISIEGSGRQSILASFHMDWGKELCDRSLLPSPFVAMSTNGGLLNCFSESYPNLIRRKRHACKQRQIRSNVKKVCAPYDLLFSANSRFDPKKVKGEVITRARACHDNSPNQIDRKKYPFTKRF